MKICDYGLAINYNIDESVVLASGNLCKGNLLQ